MPSSALPRVLITGATGFLGQAVTNRFLQAGWSVAALTRDPIAARAKLPSGVEGFSWDQIPNELDAVVHLAGESVAGGLWTRARKRRLLDSRVVNTRRLVETLARQSTPPTVFVAASGMGYYGHRGADTVQVGDAAGNDFLGHMASAWERESFAAENFGARAVVIRLGMILGNGGGPLPVMRLPFQFGLGAVIGNGDQYWPWIHRDDAAELFFQAVTDASIRGPVLGAAGEPVTQRTFSKLLATALHRPLLFRVPERVLRLGTGELGDLFLYGQRVRQDSRFVLRHTDLSETLREIADSGTESLKPA
jgi:uncharacterized protein (TIGR01777 family)